MKIPLLTIGIVSGLSVITIFLVSSFLLTAPTQKYGISVDPIIVRDSMGTETHVTVKNTGTDALTNVKIDYGGTAKSDIIPSLNPGDKVSLSPPEGSDLTVVRVTDDQGVDVTQPYRTPASAPFVGNSGYGG